MKVSLALVLAASVCMIQMLYAGDISDCVMVDRGEWQRLVQTPKESSVVLRMAKPASRKAIEGAASAVWYGDQNGSLKICIPGRAKLHCGEQVFTFKRNGAAWSEEPLSEVIECT